MDRRDFLKVSSVTFAFILMQFSPFRKASALPLEAEAKSGRYRGTDDGDIYVSHDAGKTWQLHMRLGTEYTVIGLFMDRSQQVYSLIDFKGHRFHLTLSKNETCWNTV